MNNDVQDVIQQADLLMKQGKYKSAWNLLLPYKSDPAVRKRLAWLDQKRQQASPSETTVNTEDRSESRTRLYLGIALIILLAIGAFGIYRLTQQNAAPSTPAVGGTAAAVAPSEGVTATPTIVLTATPTEIPPTENSQEVSMQQQLRQWLASVEGVSQVLSFDVDIPGDEAPLGYVEAVVKSGFNDTKIPDQIVEKLKTVLNTTQFSDLAVIISDGSTTTEYDYDSSNGLWNQTELATTHVPAN